MDVGRAPKYFSGTGAGSHSLRMRGVSGLLETRLSSTSVTTANLVVLSQTVGA